MKHAPIGILLCAGEGRRLRPLTLVRPKPLVPMLGLPALEFALRQLEALGCRLVAVNGHHLAGRLAAWLEARGRARPGLEVRFFHEERLLGTGGGLRRMLRALPRGPVLVQNGDVIHDIELGDLLQGWDPARQPIALVAGGHPLAMRVEQGRVLAFGREAAPTDGFACVHLLSEEGRSALEALADSDVIADYRRLIAAGLAIGALRAGENALWVDIGSLGRYLPLHAELAGDPRFAALCDRLGLPLRWDAARACSLGAGSRLPAGASGCVAWDGVEWDGEARASLLLDGVRGGGRLDGEIVL